MPAVLTDRDEGLVVGLLIGQGHFGGDGRQPHVTLKMHIRHEALLRWLEIGIPGSRLYGPYDHGGRRYFQWMARGPALVTSSCRCSRRTSVPSSMAMHTSGSTAMTERYADVSRAPARGRHGDDGRRAPPRDQRLITVAPKRTPQPGGSERRYLLWHVLAQRHARRHR